MNRTAFILARILLSAALLLALIMASPTKAYGYTDPGTGAFIYQAIYAGCIGATFYFRKFIRRFFGKRDK